MKETANGRWEQITVLAMYPKELKSWSERHICSPMTFNIIHNNKVRKLMSVNRWRVKKILSQTMGYSVQFSRSVVSDSLRPHESQQARPPCPSPTPGVHSNLPPSSRWCHPAISSSVIPFSSCPQSLPASEFFLMSQLFAWGGQSTGVSTLASFLPKKSQGWSPSEWTGWISLQSKDRSRFSRVQLCATP